MKFNKELLALIVALCLLVVVCSSTKTRLHGCTDLKTVKKLLKKKTDINAQDDLGRTPLHHCNDVAMAELLIRKGANVNARDNDGNTPLHLCTSAIMARFLLDKGAYVKGINALNDRGRSALFFAILCEKYKLVEQLLDYGMDPNQADSDGQTPLHEASLSCISVGIEELLVKKGAFVMARDKDGRTPLHIAARGYLCESEQIGVIPKLTKQMLELGFTLDTTDNEGRTALHYAVESRGASCIELLINGGANINIADHEGKTPWYLALQCRIKRHEIVQLMIERGAGVAENFLDGSTPLHVTVKSLALVTITVLKTIDFLVSRLEIADIDIDLLDAYGNTPLFSAMNLDEVDHQPQTMRAARFLLSVGASIEHVYWIDGSVISEFYRMSVVFLGLPFEADIIPGRGLITFNVKAHIEDLANKLHAANIQIRLDDFVPSVIERYQAEVEKLKSSVIYGKMRHYEFLCDSDPFTAKGILESNYDIASLPVEFPAYGNLLRAKIKADSFRANLLLTARVQFLVYIGRSDLPRSLVNIPKEIVDKILSNLTNAELVKFSQFSNAKGNLKPSI